MEFKKGQRVKVKIGKGTVYSSILIENNIYIVDDVDKSSIKIIGNNSWWEMDRFELIDKEPVREITKLGFYKSAHGLKIEVVAIRNGNAICHYGEDNTYLCDIVTGRNKGGNQNFNIVGEWKDPETFSCTVYVYRGMDGKLYPSLSKVHPNLAEKTITFIIN